MGVPRLDADLLHPHVPVACQDQARGDARQRKLPRDQGSSLLNRCALFQLCSRFASAAMVHPHHPLSRDSGHHDGPSHRAGLPAHLGRHLCTTAYGKQCHDEFGRR